jgi:hypothetical protein
VIKWLQRQAVCVVAKSQVGQSNASKYWQGLVAPPYPPSWCGAFTLWCFHRVGVARHVLWEIGSGYLSKFPTTSNPRKGDVAYFDKFQHEAIICGVTSTTVSLVNGNGTGSKVTLSTVPRNSVRAFFNVIG